MDPLLGTDFSKTSLFDGPGISLNRLFDNVESKIVWELIVPELFRIVNAKLTVSSSVEKSSFVYKINRTVCREEGAGCGDACFLHEIVRQIVAKIDKKIRNRFIFKFYTSKYGLSL